MIEKCSFLYKTTKRFSKQACNNTNLNKEPASAAEPILGAVCAAPVCLIHRGTNEKAARNLKNLRAVQSNIPASPGTYYNQRGFCARGNGNG